MRLRNIPGADDAISSSPYCIHNPISYKSNWNYVFHNSNPIHIEVGMGKGRFLLELARRYPNINFIGIEKYTSVLLRAVQKIDQIHLNDFSSEQSFTNIRFLCMNAEELTEVFAPEEIERIYLNFSDPWPKARHARRRLTSKEFLSRYEKIMIPDGFLEFKTDNRELFEFSLVELADANWKLHACTYDLHKDELMCMNNIMTEYEEKFSSLGNPIFKLMASPKLI